jgi:hypothetical protein
VEGTPTLDAGPVTYSAAIERAARKHRRTLRRVCGVGRARAPQMQRASPSRGWRVLAITTRDYETIALKLSVRPTLSVISAP